jgi:hypothetical protein
VSTSPVGETIIPVAAPWPGLDVVVILTTASTTLLAVACAASDPLPLGVPPPHDSEGKLVLELEEPPRCDALVGVDDDELDDELDDEHAATPNNTSSVPVTTTRVARAARMENDPSIAK